MRQTGIERLIQEQSYCVIATAAQDASPWVTPVFFNYDNAWRLVWESGRDARHSQLIAVNPRVAIVIADFVAPGADRALQLECDATEVPADRLAEALEVFLNGPHRRPEVERQVGDYAADQPRSLYEARPRAAYTMAVTYDAEGRRLDHRIPVDLPSHP